MEMPLSASLFMLFMYTRVIIERSLSDAPSASSGPTRRIAILAPSVKERHVGSLASRCAVGEPARVELHPRIVDVRHGLR